MLFYFLLNVDNTPFLCYGFCINIPLFFSLFLDSCIADGVGRVLTFFFILTSLHDPWWEFMVDDGIFLLSRCRKTSKAFEARAGGMVVVAYIPRSRCHVCEAV